MAGKKIGGGRIELGSIQGALGKFLELLNKVAAGEVTLAEASAQFKRETDKTVSSLVSLADKSEKATATMKELTRTLHEKSKALNELKREVSHTKKELERTIKTNDRLANSNDKLNDRYKAAKEAAKEARSERAPHYLGD